MTPWLKKHAWLLAALTISGIVYWRWLNFSVFTHADHTFQFAETLAASQSFNAWNPFGLGSPNALLWRLADVGSIAYAQFGAAGFASNVADKFIQLWPWIILPPLAGYLLVKKITGSRAGAFTGAIVFSFNTYFLAINTQGHILLSLASAWAALAIYAFISYHQSPSPRRAVLAAFTLFLVSIYDIRMFYLAGLLLAAYTLFFWPRHKHFRYAAAAAAPLALALALMTFWILPLVSSEILSENQFLHRNLFGSSFFSFSNSLTLHHPFWQPGAIDWFTVQPLPPMMWAVPALALLGLIAARKNPRVAFFAGVAALGVFLGKQIDAPAGGVYQWLFDNLPGFYMFREASKFYFLTALGYAVLIGALVGHIWANLTPSRLRFHRPLAVVALSAICGLFLWNTLPLISGSIDSMFIPREARSDYVILKDFLVGQPGYFRTFWTPRNSKWGFYSAQKPIISNVAAVVGNIAAVETNWQSYLALTPENYKKPPYEQIMEIFQASYAQRLFNIASIKYVIVPLLDSVNDDNLFAFYEQEDRTWYTDQLDTVPWLKKINIGTTELAVYENSAYQPYIQALPALYYLPRLNNLEQTHAFATNNLPHEFNFTKTADNISLAPLTLVQNVFEQIDPPNQSIAINEPLLDNGGQSRHYFIPAKEDIFYAKSDSSLTLFTRQKNGIAIGHASTPPILAPPRTLAAIDLNPETVYFLSINGRTVPAHSTEETFLRTVSAPTDITIYSAGENILRHPSFEEGLWQDDVQDCHNYDNAPQVRMMQDSLAADGQYSLLLEATRHVACTQQIIAVTENQEYVLQFAHQSPDGRKAKYVISFNDPARTVIEKTIPAYGPLWYTATNNITAPPGATLATLFLQAGATDNISANVVRYDNVQFRQLFPKASHSFTPPTPQWQSQEIIINPVIHQAVYQDPAHTFRNAIENGSFEDSLWHSTVNDCYKYDQSPDIAMNRVQRQGGGFALELQAKKHSACTHTYIPVKAGATYHLSFDYQSDTKSSARYAITLPDSLRVFFAQTLLASDTAWHTLARNITIPEGIEHMSITVYAEETDGIKNNVVRYDNFRLVEVPDLANTNYIVSPPAALLTLPTAVNFTSINPSQKTVSIKDARTPFFLSLGENFHPKWQLRTQNVTPQSWLWDSLPWIKNNSVDTAYHYKLNDYANAWYVDPAVICQGSTACRQSRSGAWDMEMIIEYTPQRWFYLGLGVSALAALVCIILLTTNKIPLPGAVRK